VRIEAMEGLLKASFRCECPTLEVCERVLTDLSKRSRR